MNKSQIIESIFAERDRQDAKWGEQTHEIFKWLAILGEEVGEINKAALENQYDETINELIQTGAVVVAMIESLERNKNK